MEDEKTTREHVSSSLGVAQDLSVMSTRWEFTQSSSNPAGRSAAKMMFCSTNQSLYIPMTMFLGRLQARTLCNLMTGLLPAAASYFESIPHSDPSDIAIWIPQFITHCWCTQMRQRSHQQLREPKLTRRHDSSGVSSFIDHLYRPQWQPGMTIAIIRATLWLKPQVWHSSRLLHRQRKHPEANALKSICNKSLHFSETLSYCHHEKDLQFMLVREDSTLRSTIYEFALWYWRTHIYNCHKALVWIRYYNFWDFIRSSSVKLRCTTTRKDIAMRWLSRGCEWRK